jgi:hypothetical protein
VREKKPKNQKPKKNKKKKQTKNQKADSVCVACSAIACALKNQPFPKTKQLMMRKQKNTKTIKYPNHRVPLNMIKQWCGHSVFQPAAPCSLARTEICA